MTVPERIARINQEISGVASMFHVTSWEKEFLNSCQHRDYLSEKQESVLAKIEEKVFGENNDAP